MKRLHLIEIEDQDWCPRTVRDSITDYLQFALAATNPYAALIPILATAFQRAGTRTFSICVQAQPGRGFGCTLSLPSGE